MNKSGTLCQELVNLQKKQGGRRGDGDGRRCILHIPLGFCGSLRVLPGHSVFCDLQRIISRWEGTPCETGVLVPCRHYVAECSLFIEQNDIQLLHFDD